MSSASAPSGSHFAEHVARALVIVCGVSMLSPLVEPSLARFASPSIGLVGGIAIALVLGNPWPTRTRALAQKLLAWSIVGLGAGTNVQLVLRAGSTGLLTTACGLVFALAVGIFLGRVLRVGRDTALLVTVGTSICGGSAIAAVAPVIGAKDEEVSIALVSVFLLNAIALFVFPPLGRAFELSQHGFGVFAALAIHDTSSVVGAASSYGSEALQIATATKLARAFWIIPLALTIGLVRSRGAKQRSWSSLTRLWFIAGFVIAAAVTSFTPGLRFAGDQLAVVARQVLALTLFLIGLGLSRKALRAVGVRSMVQAVLLWLILGGAALFAVLRGFV